MVKYIVGAWFVVVLIAGLFDRWYAIWRHRDRS